MTETPTYYAGIDVAKDRLDVVLRPSGEHVEATNDERGIRSVVHRLHKENVALTVLEATVLASGTPLPAPADTLLGWTVREGVTNVIRHSRARSCEVTVSRHGGEAVLEMVNDGTGKNGTENASGSGLTGLAERAADAGGRLEFGPQPGGRFRLSVAVPVREDGEWAPEPVR
jgi:signal transduction histidine kinase